MALDSRVNCVQPSATNPHKRAGRQKGLSLREDRNKLELTAASSMRGMSSSKLLEGPDLAVSLKMKAVVVLVL
jgi:hypothetical protein